MPIEPATKQFLAYLQKHPEIRVQIRATHGKTIFYAGSFFKPVWKELVEWKRRSPQLADKEMLPDVLARIALHRCPFPRLLDWAQDLDRVHPWKENGFLVWRSLSGIFAANAVGRVSFYVGSGVTKIDKVFAVTEVPVLLRNQNVDEVTKDMLAYYQRCLETKQSTINAGFITA